MHPSPAQAAPSARRSIIIRNTLNRRPQVADARSNGSRVGSTEEGSPSATP